MNFSSNVKNSNEIRRDLIQPRASFTCLLIAAIAAVLRVLVYSFSSLILFGILSFCPLFFPLHFSSNNVSFFFHFLSKKKWIRIVFLHCEQSHQIRVCHCILLHNFFCCSFHNCLLQQSFLVQYIYIFAVAGCCC